MSYYPVKVAIVIWLLCVVINLLNLAGGGELETWIATVSFGFVLGSLFASRFYNLEKP